MSQTPPRRPARVVAGGKPRTTRNRRLFLEQLESRLAPALLTVTNAVDSFYWYNYATQYPGSLRGAVDQASYDATRGISDTIVFDTARMGGTTISLTQQLELNGAGSGTVTIDGGGAVTINGYGGGYNVYGFSPTPIPPSRVFAIDSGVQAVLKGLTIQNGTLPYQGGGDPRWGGGIRECGGGILNQGTLTVAGCTIQNNSATFGAGVYNNGTLTVTGTTLEANTTASAGGGIDNGDAGVMSLTNSTVSGNNNLSYYHGAGGIGILNRGTLTVSNTTVSGNQAHADASAGPDSSGLGAGINNRGTLTLQNTIVTGNTYVVGYYDYYTGATGGQDVYGRVSPGSGHNLIGQPLGLSGISNGDPNHNLIGTNAPNVPAALASNGGPTQTMALLPGLPEVGAGGTLTGLAAAVGAAATTLTVGDASTIACTPGGYVIRIDAEQMLVTAAQPSSNTLTVTRGYNGTVAAAHAANAGVSFANDQRGLAASSPADIGAFQTQVGAAASFVVTAPTTATAGTAFPVTITARDAYGHVAAGSNSTVTLSSSDGQTVYTSPSPVPLTNGTATVSVTLDGVGSPSLSAASGSAKGSSGPITVTAAGIASLAITVPARAPLGGSFGVTVTAGDPYGNVATGYSGTVALTSSDGQPVSPATLTLVNGVAAGTVTLNQSDTVKLTATAGTFAVTSSSIVVAPNVITVTTLADQLRAGNGQVSLRDAIVASETRTSVDGSAAGLGHDIIQFAPGLSGAIDLTLVGDNSFGPSAFLVNDWLTIQGPATGPGITIQRDPNAPAFRIFKVAAGASLSLQNVTVTGGQAQGANGTSGSGGGGGGAGFGGTFFNQGNLTLFGCTFTTNQAVGGNGGASGGGWATTGGEGGGPVRTGSAGGSNGGDGVGGGGGWGGGDFGNGGGNGGFGAGGGGGGTGNNGGARGPGPGGSGGPGGPGGFGGGGGGGGWSWGRGAPGGFAGGSGADASYAAVAGGGGGAGMGGVLFNNDGTVTIADCTFAGNSARGGTGADSGQDGGAYGGALFNRDGTVTITASTFASNSVSGAQGDGSDISSLGGTGRVFAGTGSGSTAVLTLTDVIAAYPSAGADDVVAGTVNGGASTTSGSNNLIMSQSGFNGAVLSPADPLLSPLGNYGGPTPTMALLTGSPALGAGQVLATVAADQRGLPRMAPPDVGAYQAQAAVSFAVSTTGTGAAFGLTIAARDGFGNVATAYSGLVALASSDGQTVSASSAPRGTAAALTVSLTNGTATLNSVVRFGAGRLAYLQGGNLVQLGRGVLAVGVSGVAPGTGGALYYLQGSNLVQLGKGTLAAGVSGVAPGAGGVLYYLQGGNLVRLGQGVLAAGVSGIAPGPNGLPYYLQGGSLVQLGQGTLATGVSAIFAGPAGALYYLQGGSLVQLGQGVLTSTLLRGPNGEVYYLLNNTLFQLGAGTLANGVSSLFPGPGGVFYYLQGKNFVQFGRGLIASGVLAVFQAPGGAIFYLQGSNLVRLGTGVLAGGVSRLAMAPGGALYYLQGSNLVLLGTGVVATGVSGLSVGRDGQVYYLAGNTIYRAGQPGAGPVTVTSIPGPSLFARLQQQLTPDNLIYQVVSRALSYINSGLPQGAFNDTVLSAVDQVLQRAGVNEDLRAVADVGTEIVLVLVEVVFC